MALGAETRGKVIDSYAFVNTSTQIEQGDGRIDGAVVVYFPEVVAATGVAATPALPNGPNGTAIYHCNKVKMNKTTGGSEAYAKGEVLYWNDTTKLLTNVVSTNKKIGVALEDVAIGATSVLVDFDGRGFTAV